MAVDLAQSPAFAALKQSFKGDLVLSSDEGYQQAIKRWTKTSQRNAGVVAFVKDEHDVSTAVKYAVNEKLDIAIKCESA